MYIIIYILYNNYYIIIINKRGWERSLVKNDHIKGQKMTEKYYVY